MKYIKTFEEINIEEINLKHHNLLYHDAVNLKMTTNIIENYIKNNYPNNINIIGKFSKTAIIKMIKFAKNNNDHTLINLLAELLNMHKEIEFDQDIKNFNL